MKSLLDILTLSTRYLSERGIKNPRRQAEDLLCDALGVERLKLYLDFERPLDDKELTLCRERLVRCGRKEPLAYIHGQMEFYHCTIAVTPSVLIPRQETEILVDKIVKQIESTDYDGKILLDLCCGSGCIGIALKKRLPNLIVVLSDRSTEALAIAKKNAEKNQVEVELLEGDLLHPFSGRQAHFVVCNPPYISEIEYSVLDESVRTFEPKIALVSGPTGLEFYERLSRELPPHLFSGARVWFEIGYQQGENVKALFQSDCWRAKTVENDWSGHNRFFFLEKE